MTRTNLLDSLNRNYFDTLGGLRIYDQLSNSLSHNYSNRMNMRVIYKPGKNDEIMFIPNLSFQKNDSKSNNNSQTTLDNNLINSSNTDTYTNSNGYNISGDLLWRHKFAKDGRTISTMFRGALSDNSSESNQNITLNDVLTKQITNNDANGYSYGGNIQYTEPIAKNHQLSINYNLNKTNNKTDKQTDKAGEDEIYTPDEYLSSNYKSDYLTQALGFGYRINTEKLRLMANINLQRADLDRMQIYPYKSTLSYETSKSFNSLLPMAMIDYIPSQNQSFRLMYHSNSSSPSVTQLQQTIDNSNPLQLYQGNSELDQVIDHSVSLRYIGSNIEKATNWMAFFNMTKKIDYIGSDVTIASESTSIDGIDFTKGAQLTKPVNLDGYLRLNSNFTYGFPVDFLLSNLNISAGVNYNKIPGIQNNKDLMTKSLSIVPGASLTSNISQYLDFTLSYNADFNKVNNNLKSSNYDYLTHSGNAKINWEIWKGITFENNLNWKCYTGSSMDNKEQFWLWNASIGKKFLKNNRGELKLSAYDILKQNKAFSRTIADAYTQTSYSNVLSRYFMLTFTYNIQSFKGKQVMKERTRPF
jgi:hypothetical protein